MTVTTEIQAIGIELVAVFVFTLLAGIDGGFGDVVVVFVVGLALIWAMTHLSALATAVGTVQKTSQVTATNPLA